MSDLRYIIFEVCGVSLDQLRAEGITNETVDAVIGQVYATCDDEELAVHIHRFLTQTGGSEPLQLMIYDTLEHCGMTPV